MQVFTNLQFKFFWLLSIFCYVIFVGEAGWGQTENVNDYLYHGQDVTGTTGRSAPTKTLKELGQPQPGSFAEGAGINSFGTSPNKPTQVNCQTVCGQKGACYGGSQFVSKASQCNCGNNYCLTCKPGWYKNPNSTGRADRCIQGEPPTQQASGKKCNDGKPASDSDGEPTCQCPDGSTVAFPGSSCNAAAASAGDSKEQNWCVRAGGKLQEDNEFDCNCGSVLGGQELNVGKNQIVGDNGQIKLTCEQARNAIPGQDFVAICEGKGGKYHPSYKNEPHACQCESDKSVLSSDWTINDQTTCGQQVTAAQAQDEINKILQDCGYTNAVTKVNSCGLASLTAAEKCDKEALESDGNNETAKGILGILGGVHTQKGVQAGNADVCGDVAQKTTLATWALDAMKTTCEEKIRACKNDCSPFAGTNQTWDKLARECGAKIDQHFGRATANATTVRFDARALLEQARTKRVDSSKPLVNRPVDERFGSTDVNAAVAELKTYADENIAKCEGEAPSNKKDLIDYTEDVVKAAVGAAACKNAIGANANRCAQIAATLNPTWCAANRSEPCCEPYLYGNLDCVQRDYNAVACICQRNQSDPVCKTTTVVGAGNAELAAPGSTANLAAPGGIKAGAASKASSFSGDGFNVNEDPNAMGKGPAGATGPSMNPFAGTSGGGGGGGVSAPGAVGGTGGPGEKGAAEPESQGLVGGAFSALKTVADRVFGGGGSGGKGGFGPGRSADLKNKKGKIDPEKWRPTGLRGVAGASGEVGPKSRDIWKQMNAQYATQYHTFLDGIPSK